MKEMQPKTTLSLFNVSPGPNFRTDLRLPGGKTIPYVYSLSVRSTIPYIRLLGGSTSQKIFSWNEQIVVPPGEMVTVTNECVHRGDIIINSGYDYGAIPSRITIPVGVTDNGANWVPAFPLDCRRAHRAFLSGFRSAPVVGVQMQIISRQTSSSYPFNPAEAIVTDPQPGITEFRNFVPATSLDPIPLGINATQTDTAHTLLDSVTFLIENTAPIADNGSLLYMLEML